MTSVNPVRKLSILVPQKDIPPLQRNSPSWFHYEESISPLMKSFELLNQYPKEIDSGTPNSGRHPPSPVSAKSPKTK